MLERRVGKRRTPYGEIAFKAGSGYGITKEKAEYEDVAKMIET